MTADWAKVDIIFAIDDSGSMGDEIGQIQANINDFAQAISTSGLDFSVVMISKRARANPQPWDDFGICVPPPLGAADCGDNPPTFHHVDQVVASNDALDVILASYDSWKAHLRPDAYKAFVVITDDESQTAYFDFDAALLAKQPAGMFGTRSSRRYIFNSICGWEEGGGTGSVCPTAVAPGRQYQDLSKLTRGIIDSVCKTNYGSVLSNLANGIVTRLACALPIKSTSGNAIDPKKVVVKYTPGVDADAGTDAGAAQTLQQVTDASKCPQFPNSWYYDSNTSPTRIILCPQQCDLVGKASGAKLELAIGCAGETPQ